MTVWVGMPQNAHEPVLLYKHPEYAYIDKALTCSPTHYQSACPRMLSFHPSIRFVISVQPMPSLYRSVSIHITDLEQETRKAYLAS